MNNKEVLLNVWDVFIISVVGLLAAKSFFLMQLILITLLLGVFDSKIEFLLGYIVITSILLPVMLLLLSFLTFSAMRYLFSKNKKWQIWMAFGVVAITVYFTRLIIGSLGSFDVQSGMLMIALLIFSIYVIVKLHRRFIFW